ncbi:hypothetical protein WA026_001449 [Henosepilachna vigintioctopunctata]|uniref:Uncharacterized protein n=1 Tax=Henosepilachna vigintioctopunctata TaxID=420089 RepID=A0AAW1UJQ4_9CUCU
MLESRVESTSFNDQFAEETPRRHLYLTELCPFLFRRFETLRTSSVPRFIVYPRVCDHLASVFCYEKFE